jgi:hypothetical protein
VEGFNGETFYNLNNSENFETFQKSLQAGESGASMELIYAIDAQKYI